MKILMVCLGNICRSPMAEGVLQHKAAERGIDLDIDSSGTSGWHAGEGPDRRAVAAMRQFGIDISMQRSRQFRTNDFEEFDHILVMDESNYQDVRSMSSNESHLSKVKMILNYSHPGQNLPVPDPYYGGDRGFEEVYHLLNEACDAFLDQMENA